MDRKYIMKAEKAASLSAFIHNYGIAAYDKKLNCFFKEKETGTGKRMKSFDAEACCGEEIPFRPKIHPGEEIVLFGFIGMIGTVFLAEEKSAELEKTLPRHFIQSGAALKDMIGILPDPQIAEAHGVSAMYQIGEGGLLNGLCRLAADSPVGFRVDYEEVPIKQVTIEFCEVFHLNPWQLMSGGCVLMVTERGYETVRVFENQNVPCRVIGYISHDQDKVICHGDSRSHLNRPEPDELLKVLGGNK